MDGPPCQKVGEADGQADLADFREFWFLGIASTTATLSPWPAENEIIYTFRLWGGTTYLTCGHGPS